MNLLDWIFAGIFVLSALWGYKAGLVNLLVNTVAIYVGLFFSGLFAGRILSLIWDGVESKAISTAIGYVIIFIGVFLASRIAVSIINKTTKSFFCLLQNKRQAPLVFKSGTISSKIWRFSHIPTDQRDNQKRN